MKTEAKNASSCVASALGAFTEEVIAMLSKTEFTSLDHMPHEAATIIRSQLEARVNKLAAADLAIVEEGAPNVEVYRSALINIARVLGPDVPPSVTDQGAAWEWLDALNTAKAALVGVDWTLGNDDLDASGADSALESLRAVSSLYSMGWNDATMLALATAFIDRLNVLGAFRAHLIEAANASMEGDDDEDEDDGTNGQDRESYSDTQDRKCYTVSTDGNDDEDEDEDEDNRPGLFDVHVCRIGYGHNTLRIEANSADEARLKALDEAGNHSYSEKEADYTVDCVSRCTDAELLPHAKALQQLRKQSL